MSEQKADFINEYADGNIHIILQIPKDVVHLSMSATCIRPDGTTYQCSSTLYGDELASARHDFLEYVGDDDYDGIWRITKEGLKHLDELEDDRK